MGAAGRAVRGGAGPFPACGPAAWARRAPTALRARLAQERRLPAALPRRRRVVRAQLCAFTTDHRDTCGPGSCSPLGSIGDSRSPPSRPPPGGSRRFATPRRGAPCCRSGYCCSGKALAFWGKAGKGNAASGQGRRKQPEPCGVRRAAGPALGQVPRRAGGPAGPALPGHSPEGTAQHRSLPPCSGA